MIFNYEVCGTPTYSTGCDDVYDSGDGVESWFRLNSGDQSHVTFIAEDITPSNGPFSEKHGQVYVDGPDPGCDDMTLVACVSDLDIFEIVVNDYAAVLPNTDYYFKLFRAPTALYNVAGIADDGTTPIVGCSDPASCNYIPSPFIEDCPNIGCTDNAACNYWSSAGCDDGSCIYPVDLELLVYHDENYDGDNDYWDDDLGGVGTVIVEQADEILFTVIPNAEGEAIIPDMPDGTYTAYFADPSGLWTSNGTVTFTFPSCDEVEVGANPTPDTFDHFSHFFGHTSEALNCNTGLNLGFWALNIGSENLSGSITVTFDESMTVSPLDMNWSSSDATSATWNFSSHPPGDQRVYGIDIAEPSFELIGEMYLLTIDVELTNNLGEVIFSESHSSEVTVTCAYDPNDKTLMGPGTYSEAGYLDPEVENLTYRVRFQNTGNAPAQDVVIEDHIDTDKLDISTLTPMYASHPFHTVIENNGLTRFVFENIHLPDSTADLEGSQGEVFFRINVLDGLNPGDAIENTADIFFDSNPAVVTNTTSNVLFDCVWMEASSAETACVGFGVTLDPELSLSEDYSWELDDVVIGEANTPLTLDTPELGTGEVTILLSNPFCSEQPRTLTYDVISHLTGDFDLNGQVNSNDILVLLSEFACTVDCTTDLDGNGDVGTHDILLLLGAFGSSCN